MGKLYGNTVSVTTSEGSKVTKKMDGVEAMSGFAKHAVREMVKDTDVEPIDVVVSVLQKPSFRDMILGRKTAPKQVVAFHIEPPNLAF